MSGALPSVDEVRAIERSNRLAIPSGCTLSERRVASARGTLALRVYSAGAAPEPGTLGSGLVFFHGGGFVAGDPGSHDLLCGQLAVASGCTLVSCSYRLAPEHRFPVAIDDAYFAACFVHEHADEFGIDHRRVGVAGVEVGASLATGVARLAKERRNPALGIQLLIAPVVDFEPAAVSGITTAANVSLEWAVAQYSESTLREEPRCSPQHAKNLIGLPPALIVCAGQGIGKAQAERYAARMRDAHVAVTIACGPLAFADSLEVPSESEGHNLLEVCNRALREALG